MGVPRFGDCHMYYYTGAVDGLQAEKGDFFEKFYFYSMGGFCSLLSLVWYDISA